MSHRMQITLDDEQYVSLTAESERTGASMAELIRQALQARLGLQSDDQRAARFRYGAQLWRLAPGTTEPRAASNISVASAHRWPIGPS